MWHLEDLVSGTIFNAKQVPSTCIKQMIQVDKCTSPSSDMLQ